MKNNVFTSLFKYRLRDKKHSSENFLTEALAFVLREDAEACRLWVCHPLGVQPEQVRECQVLTQTSYAAKERTGRDVPDMEVRCELADGTRAVVLSEHKWGGVDIGQLDRYCGVRDDLRASGVKAKLMFVGSDYESWAQAEGHCDERLRWEQVYTRLREGGNHTEVLTMLLDFLLANGLSPLEPLQPSKVVAYAMSIEVPRTCRAIARQLTDKAKFDWSCLPEQYRGDRRLYPTTEGGTIEQLVEFGYQRKMLPRLQAGFLLDPRWYWYNGSFCDASRGIDLLFIVQTDSLTNIGGTVLSDKAGALRGILRGSARVVEQTEVRSERKLIARESLLDALSGRESEEQIQAIYGRFHEWGEVLFGDGQLERAFRETWPEAWKDK